MVFRLKHVFSAFFIVAITLLVGCSSSSNVALRSSFWTQNKQQPVVVAMAKTPEGRLKLSGPRTLVGRVSSKATTIKFSRYLKHYKLASLSTFESDFVKQLQVNGIAAKRYAGAVSLDQLQKFDGGDSYAKLNYQSVAMKLGNNRLLLLSINKMGAKRNYVVVVPTDNPVAFCDAEGQLIDLKTNKILWRYTVSKSMESSDDWDKGSSYDSFTSDLNKVVNQALSAIKADFFSRAPYSS